MHRILAFYIYMYIVLVVNTHVDHITDVALGAREFGRLFGLEVDDEEQVVPQAMLSLYVVLKRHLLVLKLAPLQTCMYALVYALHVSVYASVYALHVSVYALYVCLEIQSN